MILDELKVIAPPDAEWLTRLRRGHFVWCVKEERFAKIEWAWEPPDPGCVSGRIGIQFCWRSNIGWGTEHCQTWFIKPDGTGFDGKALLYPVQGNCPDDPPAISEPWQRQTERTMAQMAHRIELLEASMSYYAEDDRWQDGDMDR